MDVLGGALVREIFGRGGRLKTCGVGGGEGQDYDNSRGLRKVGEGVNYQDL